MTIKEFEQQREGRRKKKETNFLALSNFPLPTPIRMMEKG
jgi:hypothetical protein